MSYFRGNTVWGVKWGRPWLLFASPPSEASLRNKGGSGLSVLRFSSLEYLSHVSIQLNSGRHDIVLLEHWTLVQIQLNSGRHDIVQLELWTRV